ncbi:MAG: CAP domain-containing protein [Cardiobacteriaceae bacterium]|nr:CAP domain-containing protein [Cardiobacteriaceae bacterium]
MNKIIYTVLFLLLTTVILNEKYHREIIEKFYQPKMAIPTINSAENKTQESFFYINEIRRKSGLNVLENNQLLNRAARNHAEYLVINNDSGHDEVQNKVGFTGISPTERAFYVGYQATVSENIAFNSFNQKTAIDNLMTAIYHRFGFLDFQIDEIGVGSGKIDNNSAFVFVMGNKKMEEFCRAGRQVIEQGSFVYGFCKNEKLAIRSDIFQKIKNINSAEFIVFPNDNLNSKIYFSNETPNPVPECKITANPISIEFNPETKPIKMLDFAVYDEAENRIKNTKILTKDTDHNKKFSEKQFALFPLDVYDFGKTYRVEFSYIEGAREKRVEWQFQTKFPEHDYFIVENDDKIFVEKDKTYDLFFKPENCNDYLDSYQLLFPRNVKIDITNPESNMLRIKVTGKGNARINIRTNNGKKITIFSSK